MTKKKRMCVCVSVCQQDEEIKLKLNKKHLTEIQITRGILGNRTKFQHQNESKKILSKKKEREQNELR